MIVASLDFAAFVAVAATVYHLLDARARAWWLLATSYFFYALCAWRFAPVLAVVTLATWALGRRIARADGYRRHWLAAAIVTIVATLATLRHFFRGEPFAGPFVVVGISFYALQAISYLVDVYDRTLPSARPLRDVALYLAYFPKLVAGPIERARDFLPRLDRPHAVDDGAFAAALTSIAVGLTRKLVVADPLAALLTPQAFTAPAGLGAGVLVASLLGYVFVLYNDFAAYTDIVRGVSMLFGIELAPNFAQPFFARSFGEFWSRWHMSLTSWLRAYVYLPLSRALLRRRRRVGTTLPLVVAPMVTMLASGLWHGASLHMLLWGGLHGVYLAAEQLARSLRRDPTAAAARPPARQALVAVMVFAVGTATFSLFRMHTGDALAFWREVLHGGAGAPPSAALIFYVFLSFGIDWAQHRNAADGFLRWPRPVRAAVLSTLGLLWLVMSDRHAVTPFIYGGF